MSNTSTPLNFEMPPWFGAVLRQLMLLDPPKDCPKEEANEAPAEGEDDRLGVPFEDEGAPSPRASLTR